MEMEREMVEAMPLWCAPVRLVVRPHSGAQDGVPASAEDERRGYPQRAGVSKPTALEEVEYKIARDSEDEP